MGTSVSVAAVKPPDERWRAHKAVWEACMEAGVDIPNATVAYFDNEEPGDHGVTQWLGSMEFPHHPAMRKTDRGLQVVLDQLPEGTASILIEYS